LQIDFILALRVEIFVSFINAEDLSGDLPEDLERVLRVELLHLGSLESGINFERYISASEELTNHTKCPLHMVIIIW